MTDFKPLAGGRSTIYSTESHQLATTVCRMLNAWFSVNVLGNDPGVAVQRFKVRRHTVWEYAVCLDDGIGGRIATLNYVDADYGYAAEMCCGDLKLLGEFIAVIQRERSHDPEYWANHEKTLNEAQKERMWPEKGNRK